jgi:hypothetical protein
MKITATKVKRILEKVYGWEFSELDNEKFMTQELIKDTMKAINEILVSQGQKQFIK